MTKHADLLLALLAVALFIPLFIFRAVGPLDFWWWMSVNIGVLLGLALILDRDFGSRILSDVRSGPARKAALGIVSALLLYGVFFLGNWAALRIFSFAHSDISKIYNFKQGASVLRISALFVFILGPGEELFWRGFLQRRLQDRLGLKLGFLVAAGLYTLVHLGSGNPALIAAAAVCGLIWGGLYIRYRSLLLIAVSHTVWDLLVFVFFPFS